MPHIKPRYITTRDIEGDFTVEDYGFFLGSGSLKHVSEFWQATVAQALILDLAHAHAVDSSNEAFGQTDPELAAAAHEYRKILRLSDSYLIKANIFCLLTAFCEFAMLEIYSLVFPESPLVERPQINEDVVKPLKMRGIVSDAPLAYNVRGPRDEVRNSFTHGRWRQLSEATGKVDLHDVFINIISYFVGVEERLHNQGFNP
jgi:hypothetical protein